MPHSICDCIYSFLIVEPVTILSSVLEFLFLVLVVISGWSINFRFWKELQEERKNRPPGRKGNVIEPSMSWFCIIQMIFWPYDLLFLWVNANEIIPLDVFVNLPVGMCQALFTVVRAGRMCCAYNSLFVVLIRYTFIVHQQTANQWNYDIVSKLSKVASIAVPILMETVGAFTLGARIYPFKQVKDCLASRNAQNLTATDDGFAPSPFFTLTSHYLPASLIKMLSSIYLLITIIVFINISETFFYIQIFRKLKR